MTDDAERIAKGLSDAQAKALIAMARFEPDWWITYAEGGFTGSAANLLHCAPWRYGRGRVLVERQWRGNAYRYRATDLGRSVAALRTDEGGPGDE